MVRRTKAEAQATRSLILDTAELVFEQRGVARTTLHQIAQAAGLTRGAIYWHFKDKADLFNAMLERARMPLEASRHACGFDGRDVTVAQMRDGFVGLLGQIVGDATMRRVFEIARHKVEYVEEMHAVRERHLAVRQQCLVDVERTFRQALQRGELSKRMSARSAAVGLHSLIDGLLQNWMLDPTDFDLVRVGTQALDAYLGSLVPTAVPAA
jgi:TetR/AcrR family acrAB operon transcriptional repressor